MLISNQIFVKYLHLVESSQQCLNITFGQIFETLIFNNQQRLSCKICMIQNVTNKTFVIQTNCQHMKNIWIFQFTWHMVWIWNMNTNMCAVHQDDTLPTQSYQPILTSVGSCQWFTPETISYNDTIWLSFYVWHNWDFHLGLWHAPICAQCT